MTPQDHLTTAPTPQSTIHKELALCGGPHGWVPVDTHSTPVLPKREEAVGSSTSTTPNSCGSDNTAQSRREWKVHSQHGSGARNVPQPGASQLSNEERNDDLSSTVPSETPWQCKPEFSTDKMVGDNKILTARCRWNGTVSVPAECQISDGCVGSLCGTHAVCRSKATSTVVAWRITPVSVTAVSS